MDLRSALFLQDKYLPLLDSAEDVNALGSGASTSRMRRVAET